MTDASHCDAPSSAFEIKRRSLLKWIAAVTIAAATDGIISRRNHATAQRHAQMSRSTAAAIFLRETIRDFKPCGVID